VVADDAVCGGIQDRCRAASSFHRAQGVASTSARLGSRGAWGEVRNSGFTDHFRIATSQSLAAALYAAGIHVLLGFEASSSEGVHRLCLFPGSTSPHELERAIGACGVTDLAAESPQSDKSCEHLLQSIPKLGGITIAAHACSSGGLLVTLRGQTRARVWAGPELLAIALPGSRSGAPKSCRDIVANKDTAYARPRSLAVINANDLSAPAALSDPSCTTWIKMVSPSIEGLRQAFLDWESRIRLNSDPKPSASPVEACRLGR
jgi:hypothetical protein